MMKRLLSYALLALALAQVLLVLVSWLLSATMTEGVRSLLSSEGVRWFFGRFADIVASPLLAWLLLLAVGAGGVARCGLLAVGSHYRERLALRLTVLLLILYIGVLALLTLVPHAVLLSASGQLWPSPFSRALVPVVAFGLVLVSMSYGLMSGRYKTVADVVESLTVGISRGAPLFLLYILLIQFYESLRFVFPQNPLF